MCVLCVSINVGERYYSANVHQLLHFCDSVRYLGPLWAHSTFPFEHMNGWFNNLYHGVRNPANQVRLCNNYVCHVQVEAEVFVGALSSVLGKFPIINCGVKSKYMKYF